MDLKTASPIEIKTQINAQFLVPKGQQAVNLNDRRQKALLFNNEFIRHGTVVADNGDQYIYIVEELPVYRTQFDMYDTNHASVRASEANAENKVLIYFQEKTAKQLKNEADIKSMKFYIYEVFALIYLVTVLAMSIPMIFLVKHVARRVTI